VQVLKALQLTYNFPTPNPATKLDRDDLLEQFEKELEENLARAVAPQDLEQEDHKQEEQAQAPQPGEDQEKKPEEEKDAAKKKMKIKKMKMIYGELFHIDIKS
jgi:regulator of replication initiation timing